MTVIAKPILDGKFWILESEGIKLGTLCRQDDRRYMFSCASGTKMFDTEQQLRQEFSNDWLWGNTSITLSQDTPLDINTVYGYPTKFAPCNPVFDVQKKLPLFTKSNKSKSLYCAGYYIIKFEKGWVKSFCPKLLTIDRYPKKGPFKTLLEMKQELSSANKQEGIITHEHAN
jgi:hypothetical protein